MHYYKRNLGDYAKKCGRLSMLQHGSYTLLIDSCYDREQFPTLEEALNWTWASTEAEIEAVKFVLNRFFVLEDGKYVQKRIQEEIEAFHAKSTKNKEIATEREKNRTKRVRPDNDTEDSGDESREKTHEAPPNQEPRTKNQEPIEARVPSEHSSEPAVPTKPEPPAQIALLADEPKPQAVDPPAPKPTPPPQPKTESQRHPPCPVDAIVAAYHEALPTRPKVRLVTKDRQRCTVAFWQFVLTSKRSDGTARATNSTEALAWIRSYFERASQNDFVMGRTPKTPGHEHWKADYDYLLSDRGKTQVIEKTEVAEAPETVEEPA